MCVRRVPVNVLNRIVFAVAVAVVAAAVTAIAAVFIVIVALSFLNALHFILHRE